MNLALSPLSVVCCARVWKRPKTWPWDRPFTNSPKCEKSKDGRPFRDEGSQHPRDFQRKGISPSQNLKNFFADMLGATLRRENMYIYNIYIYQHRPQIAGKGISHFCSLLNRFKIYKFHQLSCFINIDIQRQDTNIHTNIYQHLPKGAV